jgi:SAM-dependent methyltransferase
VIGPIKYRGTDGYNAELYWRDRFLAHGASLRGPGHEGLSDQANASLNADARAALLQALHVGGANLGASRILDIGPGAGFATSVCAEAGVRHYLGLDITDALFGELRARFPIYQFLKGDISTTTLKPEHDVVLILEVLEHIVSRDRLASALTNAAHALTPGGLLVLALNARSGSPKRFFYLRFWDFEEIAECLPGFEVAELVPWRFGKLMACRRVGSESGRDGGL